MDTTETICFAKMKILLNFSQPLRLSPLYGSITYKYVRNAKFLDHGALKLGKIFERYNSLHVIRHIFLPKKISLSQKRYYSFKAVEVTYGDLGNRLTATLTSSCFPYKSWLIT